MPRKKSPVTGPGIDPGTFRLVAQYIREVSGGKRMTKSVPLSVLMESARGRNGRSSAENAPSTSLLTLIPEVLGSDLCDVT
jgi:hypothetical protein